MKTEDYVKQKNVDPQTTTSREFLEVLASYGENHWWVSENPRTRAYYQALDQSSPLILLTPGYKWLSVIFWATECDKMK